MSALAAVGPPNPREDPECCSVLHGLVAAVESLCKLTELQHEQRTVLMDTAERVANRGRIICLTNAKRWVATRWSSAPNPQGRAGTYTLFKPNGQHHCLSFINCLFIIFA